MNNIELTLQRQTDSGYPVIAALTRPGGFLPLRREGMLTLILPLSIHRTCPCHLTPTLN